jgi:hypothetical protein
MTINKFLKNISVKDIIFISFVIYTVFLTYHIAQQDKIINGYQEVVEQSKDNTNRCLKNYNKVVELLEKYNGNHY